MVLQHLNYQIHLLSIAHRTVTWAHCCTSLLIPSQSRLFAVSHVHFCSMLYDLHLLFLLPRMPLHFFIPRRIPTHLFFS